ncbi:iron complex transport system substrate-binding protein [Oceanobacillus limi]|uniref:Iron complex transport system substrate-binding protein n=1 Tax=Oceanobacillus limi TaxID=930131 RepID=A0A1I0D645_9BACI|nr:iron-siderophore ABC transporter substrate-binding protein [Oceanobacillus limi]SET27652.1 iron complex transport system substrate-binding protein [Oceanobacillus limi]
MRKILAITIFIALTLLVACGGDDDGENQAQDGNNSNEEQRSVTIEDANGEQTITGTPENIVVLEWSYAEHLLSLGIQPAGVADLDGFHQWVNIDEEFDESVEDVGTRQEPNLEAISRLNPDLIIAVDFRHEQYLDSLEDIAPVVTFAPYGEAAIEDHYQNMIDEFKTIATIMDRENDADEALADLDSFIEEQKQRVVDAELEGAKYLSTQAYTAQNTPILRLFTDNSIVAQVMGKLGFENAYESDTVEVYGYSEVNVEALQNFQEEDLQFLYIVQEDDNIFENQLKGNPVWENLSFVEQGNTHALPGDTWTFGGLLSAEVLAEQLVDAMVNE